MVAITGPAARCQAHEEPLPSSLSYDTADERRPLETTPQATYTAAPPFVAQNHPDTKTNADRTMSKCHGTLALLVAVAALVSVLAVLSNHALSDHSKSNERSSPSSQTYDAPQPPAIWKSIDLDEDRSLLDCEDDLSKTFRARGVSGRVNCEDLSKLSISLITQTCEKNNARISTICPATCGLCSADSLGVWGELFDMNLIAIFSMLLFDGKMLVYGGDGFDDNLGPGYEIWDTAGDESLAESHTLLTHSIVGTILFCTTASMNVFTGNILLMGGDNGGGLGSPAVTEFNVNTYEMQEHTLGTMHYPRWYGSSINLPDGRIFIAGGRSDIDDDTGSSIPEIWDRVSGFRALPRAELPVNTFGPVCQGSWWWYPLVFVNSRGNILVMCPAGFGPNIYRVGVGGQGSIKKLNAPLSFLTEFSLPSIQYDVNQIVLMDVVGNLWNMDISNPFKISVTQKASLGYPRYHSGMTLLPDGRVAIVGGCTSNSEVDGTVESAVLNIQIWDPVTDQVFTSSEEQGIARLYHSSTVTLPDGRIFSGGGGVPGPITNLDGQIYSPGYLFGEGPRPVIFKWSESFTAGKNFVITVDDSSVITKVTATKPGFQTHSRNFDSRWLNLRFKAIGNEGTRIRVFTPGPNTIVPGLWMLNVIDTNGVPSEGKVMWVKPVS